jgi:hypothetical protein
MCVEILKSEEKQSYKPELPFEDQVRGSKEVLIDCEPSCPKVAKFLDEIVKICKNGQSLPITIRLADNTNIKLFSKIKKLNKELLFNDIVGKLVLLHKNMDTKLQEISEMCLNGKFE